MFWGLVVLALGAAPDRVGAEAPSETPETPPPAMDEDPLERARRLYSLGRTKFETFDYTGAIDLWTRASNELPETPENRSIRSKLMFNIAAARVAAYDIDENIGHLRQAKRLMDRYVESIQGIDDAETAEALRWQQKIEERLAEAERAREESLAATAPDEVPEEPADEGPVGPIDEPPPDKLPRILTITGAVTAGVGAALIGAMAGGIVWGNNLQSDGEEQASQGDSTAGDLQSVVDRGRTANGLAIGAGVAGGVLVAGGVAMIVVGQLRKKSSKRARAGAAPMVGGGMATLEVRF